MSLIYGDEEREGEKKETEKVGNSYYYLLLLGETSSQI